MIPRDHRSRLYGSLGNHYQPWPVVDVLGRGAAEAEIRAGDVVAGVVASDQEIHGRLVRGRGFAQRLSHVKGSAARLYGEDRLQERLAGSSRLEFARLPGEARLGLGRAGLGGIPI